MAGSGAGATVAETGTADDTGRGARDRRASPRWRMAARVSVAAAIAAVADLS